MNHYERLKVSQDAPAEVIRAAYRALAGKLHPDRQGAETGPGDSMHSQMAALNAAYEILIDPKLRRDYDATLVSGYASSAMSAMSEREEASQGPSTRVDLDWLTPKSDAPLGLWPPSRRMAIVGGAAATGLGLFLVLFAWQVFTQHRMDQALSDQYAARPPVPVSDEPAALGTDAGLAPFQRHVPAKGQAVAQADITQASPAAHRPTVQELARMSDDELLKVLPTLDGEAPAARVAAVQPGQAPARAEAHHPLDGKRLDLRTDSQLIDRLAPEPARKP